MLDYAWLGVKIVASVMCVGLLLAASLLLLAQCITVAKAIIGKMIAR